MNTRRGHAVPAVESPIDTRKSRGEEDSVIMSLKTTLVALAAITAGGFVIEKCVLDGEDAPDWVGSTSVRSEVGKALRAADEACAMRPGEVYAVELLPSADGEVEVSVDWIPTPASYFRSLLDKEAS